MTREEYMKRAQQEEPRKIIAAENYTMFRAWCQDHHVSPQQIRLGKHPEYLAAFVVGDDIPRKIYGLRRGLKWIEVGRLPFRVRQSIECRMPEWVDD